jgi:arylformamidase
MRIYDISLALHTRLACWPGDAPYEFRWTCKKSAGATVNVGQVSLSVHAGTHTDAGFHFSDSGPTVEALELGTYLGPACVLDVSGREVIRTADLQTIDVARTPRVLLRTGAWTDHSRFPERIPVLDTDVPDWLAERGAVLVGLDVPSVDAIDSKDLPNHHALGSHGIAILESLDLAGVPEGVYELIALPLKLVGADGSPIRAVLRSQ